MFLQLPNLLAAAEVEAILKIARATRFIDGKRSNPHNLAKQNVIADTSDPNSQQASQIALGALQRSEEAKNFILPRRVLAPTLSRYGTGMKYGTHTDAAFLPVGSEPLRSDVSCTIFISSPHEYQGGELLIHLGSETLAIKGAAGSAVLYPSTTLHEVVPVSAGERLVMVTFIESQIPDQLQRELLYILGEVRALEGLKMEWQNRTRMEFAIANLHRMWSR